MQALTITAMALLLAHLLGDFPLQPAWISQNKGTSLCALLVHGAVHDLLAWSGLLIFTAVSGLSLLNHLLVLGYIGFHLLVDHLKYRLISSKILPDNSIPFLLDQLLHIALLGCLTILLPENHLGGFVDQTALSMATRERMLAIAIVYVAVVFGGGHLIRNLTKGLAHSNGANFAEQEQLPNAGLYIGWLERLLVLTAIAVQTPALVGLILTGKSIARFPELKDRRFVEYFLIGTLLSLFLSLVGGIVLHQIIYETISLK